MRTVAGEATLTIGTKDQSVPPAGSAQSHAARRIAHAESAEPMVFLYCIQAPNAPAGPETAWRSWRKGRGPRAESGGYREDLLATETHACSDVNFHVLEVYLPSPVTPSPLRGLRIFLRAASSQSYNPFMSDGAPKTSLGSSISISPRK
jgi:hypothetical protein